MLNSAVCFLDWYWSLNLLCLSRVENYLGLVQTKKSLWSECAAELLTILSSGAQPGIFLYHGFLGNVWGELSVWDWDGCLVLELLANLQWVSVPISVVRTATQQPSQTRLSLLNSCFSFWSCSAVQQVILEGPRWKWKARGSTSLTAKLQHTRRCFWLLLMRWFVIS